MTGHIHDMKPDRLPMPTVYACSSCAFRCTPAALQKVKRNPGVHRVVKADSPQSREAWNG